jgi:hypothetical protein
LSEMISEEPGTIMSAMRSRNSGVTCTRSSAWLALVPVGATGIGACGARPAY